MFDFLCYVLIVSIIKLSLLAHSFHYRKCNINEKAISGAMVRGKLKKIEHSLKKRFACANILSETVVIKVSVLCIAAIPCLVFLL